MTLLRDPSPRLRLLAAGSLLDADTKDSEVTAVLSMALDDPAVRIRRAALECLIAHESLDEALIESLRRRAESEDDPEVSRMLGEVLERVDQAVAQGAT